mmetsp:Transcript_23029/g.66456  ORF Transcript_23029/g.66456 Transcript_23029/m.66456 type:complete len:236 (+) Transcript_23029:416-1123(+)
MPARNRPPRQILSHVAQPPPQRLPPLLLLLSPPSPSRLLLPAANPPLPTWPRTSTPTTLRRSSSARRCRPTSPSCSCGTSWKRRIGATAGDGTTPPGASASGRPSSASPCWIGTGEYRRGGQWEEARRRRRRPGVPLPVPGAWTRRRQGRCESSGTICSRDTYATSSSVPTRGSRRSGNGSWRRQRRRQLWTNRQQEIPMAPNPPEMSRMRTARPPSLMTVAAALGRLCSASAGG